MIKIETWTKEVRKINNNNIKVAEYQSKLKVAEYQKYHEEETEEEKIIKNNLFTVLFRRRGCKKPYCFAIVVGDGLLME